MADRTAWRLLGAARPYWGVFVLGIGATLVASVLDTISLVILVPLLKALLGRRSLRQRNPLEQFPDQVLARSSQELPRAPRLRLWARALGGAGLNMCCNTPRPALGIGAGDWCGSSVRLPALPPDLTIPRQAGQLIPS